MPPSPCIPDTVNTGDKDSIHEVALGVKMAVESETRGARWTPETSGTSELVRALKFAQLSARDGVGAAASEH